MGITEEQRGGLRRAKLAALVRDLDGGRCAPTSVGRNAAAAVGSTGYFLSDVATPATLGGSLAWTVRQGLGRVVLFLDDLGGDVARWATYFSLPVEVRTVSGAGSVEAVPTPLPRRIDPDSDAVLEGQLRDQALEVVVEGGVVRGEVRGLEVARLVRWPAAAGGDDRLHLEVGVGRFDRDASAAVHGDESQVATLAACVTTVRAERVPGGGTHPMSRLARERWLRSSILQDPSSVGCSRLTATETTVAREGIRDVVPAAAVGESMDGRPVVVVCSTGADLSFVPVAADTRAWLDPAADLVLGVPHRDRLPILDRLAALLGDPASVVSLSEPWSQPPTTDPAPAESA